MYEKKRIFARVITKNNNIMTNLLLFGLGLQEIVVIALIVLLLFGGKKIPELMKGLGKGVKSFKDGMKEIDVDDKEVKSESEVKSEE
jgi:sec-independent protein translocase protein TatA